MAWRLCSTWKSICDKIVSGEKKKKYDHPGKSLEGSIVIAVRATCNFLYILKFSALLCSFMIFLNSHEKSIIQNKSYSEIGWKTKLISKVRVIAKNTPLSLPLKGMHLLTCSPSNSLKPATDEISTDSIQSAWQQTLAQCLATQDNGAQNKDQHTNSRLSYPGASRERTALIYFWRAINNTVTDWGGKI